MTTADDFPGEMDTFPFDGPFDSSDADALFGATPGSVIPEALRDVAELVQAARQPGSEDELAAQDVIVAQVAAAIGEHLASPTGDAHERTPILRKFRTAKVAAAATAALMLGATAAAAATGSLPAPVQSSVASGLSGVGIDIPAHHHVELAAKHAATPAHARGHHHPMPKVAPGAAGVVASVNGVTTTGACGVPATAGVFTLTGHKGATFTVNVAMSTTVLDKGVTGASFGNVCVGAEVFATGAVSGTTVTATKILVIPPRPPHVPSGAAGVVASVNGVTTTGACGTPATAGVFTLTGHTGATFTVNVATSTTYSDKGVTGASFGNVCVGAEVFATGTVSGTTVTATNVQIVPMRHKDEHHHMGAFGTVASVNGSTTAGACGAASMPGAFTLTGFKGSAFTVNVTSSTKFYEFGVKGATFANVCVGAKVGAAGDVTGTTVAATNVFVLPANPGFRGFHPKRGRGRFPKGFALGGKVPAGIEHAGTGPKGPGDGAPDHSGPDHGGSGAHGKRGGGSKHGH